MNDSRQFLLNDKSVGAGASVVYWMSRDQRVWDNHALLAAATFAKENEKALNVVFCLDSFYPNANLRSFDFLVRGLQEVSEMFAKLKIPFRLLYGHPTDTLPICLKELGCAALFSDFDPLRVKQQWKVALNQVVECPHYEVDTHNIVPCRLASPKEEFGAYTIRPKINRLLPEFMDDLLDVEWQQSLFTSVSGQHAKSTSKLYASEILKRMNLDRSVGVLDLAPGEKGAHKALSDFIEYRLADYNELRNYPEKECQSNLSPYLHYGQLSAQRVALEVQKADVALENKAAYLEELIVRRELSDNYCFYNPNYDNIAGAAAWAQKTLSEHALDEREYLYSLPQFEQAKTHDRLWNAAQKQLLLEGKIHGYMRMYWAKKILEWTISPAQALEFAIFLNDKYALDGRDPNGYVGCQWAICGVHDRAWGDRPVFGKIRFMNANGCKRKFDVEAYMRKFESSKLLF